jgi:hypothetical protein
MVSKVAAKNALEFAVAVSCVRVLALTIEGVLLYMVWATAPVALDGMGRDLT